MAEAYRTIPLVPLQWAGVVVRLDAGAFAVDSSASFGVGSHAGVYGNLADAGADIMRAKGIGPLAKWVDDNVFLQILREHLPDW